MKKITKILSLTVVVAGMITPLALMTSNSAIKTNQKINKDNSYETFDNSEEKNAITDNNQLKKENSVTSDIKDNSKTDNVKFSSLDCVGLNNKMGVAPDADIQLEVLNGAPMSNIAKVAFVSGSGCSAQNGLTIPDEVSYSKNGYKFDMAVTKIGEFAFFGCDINGKLVISNGQDHNGGINSIEAGAFSGCRGITQISFNQIDNPTTVQPPVKIGTGAFNGCNGINLPIDFITTRKWIIGDNAFIGCSEIPALTINDNIVSIGVNAFSGCSGLTSLDLSNATNLQKIPDAAFQDCSGLTGPLTIPASVTSIGNSAFSGCSGLNGALTLPNNLTSIASSTFSNCSNLTGTLTIPASVTSIGDSAFQNCSSLTGLDLSSAPNLQTIGKNAFENLSNINSLTIPDTVTSIGSSAFSNCSKISSLIIPAGITVISSKAFANCTNITDLVIPSNITSIYESAFGGCTKLVNLDLSNADKLLSLTGFNDCTGLTSVSIPASVTSIDNSAFQNCTNLFELNYPSNKSYFVGKNAFENCTLLTSINFMPTSVGDYAFKNCTGLSGGKLILSDKLSKLGTEAFMGCNFQEVTCLVYPIFPTIGENVFAIDSATKSDTVITVAKNSKSAWDRKFSQLGINNINQIQERIVIPTNVTISNLKSIINVNLYEPSLVLASPKAIIEPADVDDPSQLWEFVGTVPSWLQIDPATGVISTKSDDVPSSIGTYSIAIKVSCNANPLIATATAQTTLNVIYQPISSLEIEPIAPVDITLGDPAISTLATCKVKVLPDGSDQTKIKWSIPTDKPDWLEIDPITGVISTNQAITTIMPDSVDYTIKVDSTDGSNKSATQNLKINFIRPTPTGFVINSEADYVGIKNEKFQKQLTATPIPAYADPSVTWSLRNAPSGLIISPDGILTSNCENIMDKTSFTIVATSTAPGATNIESTFNSNFSVKYASATGVEFIDPTPAQNTEFNYELNSGVKDLFTCNAKILPSNAEPMFHYSLLSGAFDGLKINSDTGVVSVDNITDPGLAKGDGKRTISVRVQPQNDSTIYRTRSFVIKFKYPDPQAITGINNAQSNYELSLGETINSKLEAVLDFDYSNPDVNWELINQPEGMTIDSKTGLLQYTPTKVVDKTDFQIKVSAANNPAVFFIYNSSIIVKYAAVQKIEITALTKSDFDIILGEESKNLISQMQAKVYPDKLVSQDVTWSIDNKPNWLVIDSKTGKIDIDKITDVSLVSNDYHDYVIRATSDQDPNVSSTTALKIKFSKPGITSGEIIKISSKYKRTFLSDVTEIIASPEIQTIHDYEDTNSKWSLSLEGSATLPNWIHINDDTGVITVDQITNEADVGKAYKFIIAADNNITHFVLSKEFTVEIVYQKPGDVSITAPDGTYFEAILGTLNETKIGHLDVTVQPYPGASQQVIWTIMGGLNKWLRIDDNGDIFVKDVTDEKLLENGGNRKFKVLASAVNFSESSDDIEITINVKRPPAESVNIDATSIDANYLLTTIETKQVNCKAKVNSQYADQSVNWSIESATNGLIIPDSITIDKTTGILTIKNSQPIQISLKIIAESSTNELIPADTIITTIKIDYPNAEDVDIHNLNDEYTVTQDDEMIYTISGLEATISPIEAVQGVNWYLLTPVSGVSIDTQTGVITIDITQVILYEFTVVAKCKTNETISGQKSVKVNVLEKKLLSPTSILTITVLSTATPAIVAAGSTAFVFKKKIKR